MLHHRFEFYLGKAQREQQPAAVDNRTGPTAVVQNLKQVLTRASDSGWRVVTIDHFYSGVPLALQLLQLKVYCVGTVISDRHGYCKAVVIKA